jgi:predicted phosphodiesterase
VRVAALYDVHGNLPALEAVLAEVGAEGVDAIVVGGDVLWGPLQSECLAALRSREALFLAGNCERDVLGAVNESSAWCRSQLSSDELEFVSAWPMTVDVDVGGLGTALFCHATPRSDVENLTRATPDADIVAALGGVDADLVVCGHTHVQYDRETAGAPRVVNAGSVGLPYQGQPGAFWAMLGPGVELRRTEYDVDVAVALLANTGFPSAAEIFADSLLGTADAESATAYFQSRRAAARG